MSSFTLRFTIVGLDFLRSYDSFETTLVLTLNFSAISWCVLHHIVEEGSETYRNIAATINLVNLLYTHIYLLPLKDSEPALLTANS